MPAEGSRGADEHGWEVLEPTGDALRGAMRLLPTGVTVVTSGREERAEGMTANALISVSLNPLLFLVSVHKDARLNPRIKEEGYFAVNILAEDQEGLSRLFASPERSSGLQRSEEHTSELQSRQYLVCRLLLEKKKKLYLHFITLYLLQCLFPTFSPTTYLLSFLFLSSYLSHYTSPSFLPLSSPSSLSTLTYSH